MLKDAKREGKQALCCPGPDPGPPETEEGVRLGWRWGEGGGRESMGAGGGRG